MTIFSLAYPPSVNSYYRATGGKVLISAKGRAYRQHVCACLLVARVRPMAGPLEMVLDLFPPDKRRRDVDNSCKALLDAIQHGGGYHDDSQIARLVITRREVCPPGRVEVRISPWEGAKQ